MANEAGKNERRLPITFWDGTNAAVDKAIARPQELLHTENARSKIIGTIEKREGQTIVGTNTSGARFNARDNYDLAFVSTGYAGVNGLYLLSGSGEPYTSYNVTVHENLSLVDSTNTGGDVPLRINLVEDLTLTEVPMHGVYQSNFFYVDNTDYSDVNMYKLSEASSKWNKLSDTQANNIAGANFTHTSMDGKEFFVNGRDYNRYIDQNGTSVVDSTSGGGSLFNSPKAKIINSYKGRLYLANYTWQGVHYGNTVLVSSFPLGIVALIQGDVLAASGGQWTLPVTDNSYIYTDSGANTYEVWRINTHVADITISSMDELNLYVADPAGITWFIGTHTFLSQDQIYVSGAVTGPKVYRWPNNPTLLGQDVKQYSTFKLTGADESDITMEVNVGNVMLIANRSMLASWNDSVVNYFDLGIGCVSERGFIKAYGALYFLHYTGIYATSGGMPNILSSPIKPYLEGATKAGLENATAGRKDRSVFFCIGEVTLYNPDGSVKSTLPDVCLEYDITQQNWYVHTGVSASVFEGFISESDPTRLLFADDTTKGVKAFLEGDTDDGKEIFFRADTQPFPIAANVEDLSNPQLVIIESERGSSMECYVSIDGEEYYPLEGQAEKGITRLKVHGRDAGVGNPPVGHYVALSFRDSSVQRCKIGRVAITFVPTGVSNPQ